jgi:Asp-tRNA(Asn)/Glu-tRNA(Gln) amidotransferase B subunit
MKTITVQGSFQMPRRMKENLSKFTTVKECNQRRAEIESLAQETQEEIEQLEDYKRELEDEDYWLPDRIAQILEENPEEAELWAHYRMINNPNQQRRTGSGATSTAGSWPRRECNATRPPYMDT